MYHYVREFDPKRPKLRFLPFDSFRAQLDYFQEHYGFASRKQWEAAAASQSNQTLQGKVVLTFDDALSCSYDFVYPELKARGLWGMFFVPSGPYQTGTLLNVHKIHLLCASVPTGRLSEISRELICEEYIPFKKRDAFRQDTYTLQRDQEQILRFKRALNYYVDETWRDQLIDDIAMAAGLQFRGLDYYISKDQIREMSQGGMIIGAHSVNHQVMSKISIDAQRRELVESRDFLRDLGVATPLTYCHPYGGVHTYTHDTLRLLRELGFEYAFDVRSQVLRDEDWSRSRYSLPRFDCNEFPFGDAFRIGIGESVSVPSDRG